MLLLVRVLFLCVSWKLVESFVLWDKMYFMQKPARGGSKTLLVISRSGEHHEGAFTCDVFTEKHEVEVARKLLGDKVIQKPSAEEMQDLLEDCEEISHRRERRQSGEYPGMRNNGERKRNETQIRDDTRNVTTRRNGQRSETEAPVVNGNRDNSSGNNTNRNFRNSMARRYNTSRDKSDAKPREGIMNGNRTNSSRNNSNKNFRNGTTNSRRDRSSRVDSSTNLRGDAVNGTPANSSNTYRNHTALGNSSINSCNRSLNSSKENPDKNSGNVTSKSNCDKPIDKEDKGNTTQSPQEVDVITSTEADGYNGWPIVLPGTKWCGAGDRAKHFEDLGFNEDSDKCCRAHDLCNDTIAPGETKNNLTNDSRFTKLSCQCDEDFYNCLDSINSMTSNTIGNMYFNILRRRCYEKNYPLTDKCKTYKTFMKIMCKEYERDTSAPMVYQWVPAKTYKKIPIPGPLTIHLPF